MKLVTLLLAIVLLCLGQNSFAQTEEKKTSRLTFGGYGEVVYRHFDYTDDFNRYTYPENFTERVSRGQTDIPHLVFNVTYDFGKGWKVSSEIEFEHGGVGSEMEIEAEEFGEYETEVEKGGEVILEQFWIEKSFSSRFNIRAGHIIVPVGSTNYGHLPTEYFTVMRPEGESTIIPQTWHENGISIHGRLRMWDYDFQLVNGLDVDAFGSSNWVNGGSISPYEYKLATSMAGAFRINNYSVNGLRIGLSGYAGNSAGNSLKADRYDGLKGTVLIGSADAEYRSQNLIARSAVIYGNLSESAEISKINKSLPSAAPSPHTDVAKNAASFMVEAGYNVLSFFPQAEGQLYTFLHYTYYNSMQNTVSTMLADARYKRQLYTLGLNYYPIPQIALKAEYSMRVFDKPYNQENTLSLGVTFSGMFN
ncbi:hypothetical protein SLH46_19370 [Draconibacterium sp. IB214405]|uniref:hypothetical protein n=1 Tax=Draconibacterium sp. IB214405 TaxID=3097352 RepID=UPI002A1671F4|nr:hypothetical protein [Draconibacterium sp. IB214405]MDX8341368.1 hypothetical protein [Draconibacterium sp. IB214405]